MADVIEKNQKLTAEVRRLEAALSELRIAAARDKSLLNEKTTQCDRLQTQLSELRIAAARDKSQLNEKTTQCDRLQTQLDSVIELYLNMMG